MVRLLRPVMSKSALKKRLMRFWNTEQRSRNALQSFVSHIEQAGTVGVFGGMVRDFAGSGVKHFNSDIDLVVATGDPDHLKWLLSGRNSTQNRFGGWRLCVDKWLIDVWASSNTWAFSQRYVEHTGNLDELPQTTFFNWDAAVFEIKNKNLHLIDDYILSINSGILDINLPENPNPFGMVFRTWNFMRQGDISISPRLTFYINNVIEKDEKLIAEYGRSKKYNSFTRKEFINFKREIHKQVEYFPLLPFSLPSRQLRLRENVLLK